ncbi:TPA: hypothetical protein JI393_RS14345 [Acinetobacter baumannii]|uniref:hypothetical protein n=1 Tax=Acinetobacter indicus TaxID=756892 RepID=UPI000CEBB20D|nr:hypothetical protein [Acinetobacter indicus]HBI1384558.1 hypothetical protein [Acinetobacter baumannii]HBI9064016.1 hypothetical protein [Acinetobacter baumannii]
MAITFSQVKHALHAHAQASNRPEYTNYVARSVHAAILEGESHPLKGLVTSWIKAATAKADAKNKPAKNSKPLSRLARNRIAAKETLAIGENHFIGECPKHGYAKFYVYVGSGHACLECRKGSRVKE